MAMMVQRGGKNQTYNGIEIILIIDFNDFTGKNQTYNGIEIT